jgi:hypothetical protein
LSRIAHYTTMERTDSSEAITLSAFGGALGDPVAAHITLNGVPRVKVLAPRARLSSWNDHDEVAFRAAVRTIACLHPHLSGAGAVSVLFDPAQMAMSKPTDPRGETIDRDRCR